MELLIVWLVTTLSLLVISRIGLFGIDIEDFGTALVVAVVLGLLNAVLKAYPHFPLLPLTVSDIRPLQCFHQCCRFLAGSGPGQGL